MAANKAQQQQLNLERAFMRGPHMSESVEQTVKQQPESVNDDVESGEPKLKWYQTGFPNSVYFIISNEFCERFTYYGMKAILTLYLRNGLLYDANHTVVIYHAFSMLCYFTPIFGGMIADVWWGKYLTIVLLSFVYAIGNGTTAMTSFSTMQLDIKKIGCFTGLILIGIGTGGIKPCVSSFGADQIPEERAQVRSKFFAAFYFAINAGSMLSTIITPMLRTVECGDGPCYPLAFGVPAALMIVAIVIFLIGTPLYIRSKPQGNVLVEVFKCIGRAISNWSKYRKTSPKPGLLDYADDKFSAQFIADVRACKRIIIMMLPVPVFWALYDQTGSTWTLQGQKMDGTLGPFYILPDQFQVINPVLVMLFIPLFQTVIYPCFYKCNFCLPNRLLQRMVIGGLLASLAFVAAAAVQYVIEPTAFKEAGSGNGWIQPVSADNGGFSISANNQNYTVQAFQGAAMDDLVKVPLTTDQLQFYTADGNPGNLNVSVPNRAVLSIVYNRLALNDPTLNGSLQILSPDPFDDSSGVARVVWVNSPETYLPNVSSITIIVDGSSQNWTFSNATSEFQCVPQSNFDTVSTMAHSFSLNITYDDGTVEVLELADEFQNGIDSASILILAYNESKQMYNIHVVQVLPQKSYSIFLMVPQYVILTCGEILFSISGLDFAYSQAPTSMRSVMMAVWLLTVAFGNLIVLVFAEIQFLPPPGMSLFYSALMAIDVLVFAVMAYFYVYIDQVEVSDKEQNQDKPSSNWSPDSSQKGDISGTPPPGYNNVACDNSHDELTTEKYEYKPTTHVAEETNL